MKLLSKTLSCLIIGLLSTSLVTSHASQEVMDFWNGYDAHQAPLNVKVLKEWQTDKGSFRLVIFDLGQLVGTNKIASPKIAAYYGFPRGAGKVPGIVHIHGGGQRAEKGRVESWVELGFACISINWGALPLEEGDLPNTDWDGIAAGFIRPGITKADGLDNHELVRPDPNTLYKEPHLLNSSWSLTTMSARRALTFLEAQPEVDAGKLGVEGHSMGGCATVMTAIDPRVKAASPSVGGSGYLIEDMWGLPNSKRAMRPEDGLELYKKAVSEESFWPHIKAPILFLGATNDFNAPTELVVKGMSLLPPSTERIMAMAPHLNHRFDVGTDSARFLWMKARLKGDFHFPKQSRSTLILKTGDHIPVFSVHVDKSSGLEIKSVDIYYSYGRDSRIRFWRSATVKPQGDDYSAQCPVFDPNEPLYAFANITYKSGFTLPPRPGVMASDILTVSSEYQTALPAEIQKAGVVPTVKPDRTIDDFSRGMQDWYILSQGNTEHWFYATRKLLDPAFMGPKGGILAVDLVTTTKGNKIAVGVEVNTWQNYTGRKQDSYYALVDLPNDGLNTINLGPADFKNATGQPLLDWDEITELTFTPSNKIKSGAATNKWMGACPVMKKLSWVGGQFVKRPYPHEARDKHPVGEQSGFDEKFQEAIDHSVELENKDKSKAK